MCCEASIGVDVVCISGMRSSLARFGDRFKRRIFSDHEIDYCDRQGDPAQSFAARFAAKEAVIKAIGLPSTIHSFRGIEVISGSNGGAPKLVVQADTLRKATVGRVDKWSLSLSHDGDYAIGMVFATKSGECMKETNHDVR